MENISYNLHNIYSPLGWVIRRFVKESTREEVEE